MKAKKFFVTILSMVAIIIMATPTLAAGVKNPYKDVTPKSVGKEAYRAVIYVKNRGCLEGVFGKKMHPYDNVGRINFLLMLSNATGDIKKVPITISDLKKANRPITAKWAVKKMVAVAKKYGVKIKWAAPNTILTNVGACQYLAEFLKFCSFIKPPTPKK